MNVFILTDLEGITGVTSIEHMDRTGEKYKIACECLVRELNYVAEVCHMNGADKIYYLDGHGGGGNIAEDKVLPCLTKADIPMWQQLLKEGKIDCHMEIGSHARAGTINGFLDHTQNSRSWFKYTINGYEFSELGMHAIICGLYDVPIVLCIGDEVACQQAKEFIPDIYTAAVKTASCRNECQCYENADEIIKSNVEKALKNYNSIKPFNIKYPAEIELTYYRTDMCEEVLVRCDNNVIRKDARTLYKVLNKINSYYDLRF